MEALKRLADIIDTINKWVGTVVSYVAGLLVVVIFSDVAMRYMFNISYVFTQELEWHLFGFVFLMGAGYTLMRNAHVRVDIFYARLSARGKAWVDLVCSLAFLFPGCYVVIKTSIPFVITAFLTGEGSPDPGGIPHRFILKTCIPLGFMLFAMQGVSLFLRNLFVLTGHAEPEKEAN